jgi:hypothetical protein
VPPAAVADATAAYLEAEDAVAAWMTECCERASQEWETSSHSVARARVTSEMQSPVICIIAAPSQLQTTEPCEVAL